MFDAWVLFVVAFCVLGTAACGLAVWWVNWFGWCRP